MCIHMAGSYLYTIGGAPLSSLRREIAGKRFAVCGMGAPGDRLAAGSVFKIILVA